MTTVINESGFVGTDGKLHLPMDRLNAFFRANKGKRVTIRIEALAPGSTSAQLAYYYNYILPTIQQSFYEQGTRMTEDQTDRMLVGEFPMDVCKADGERAEIAREMNQSQMSEFIGWLKEYAAENLDVYIADPKNI